MDALKKTQTITTTVGEVPECDLKIVENYADQGDVWVTTRECTYFGTEHIAEVGKVIRRDVWVTFKQGQASKIVSEL